MIRGETITILRPKQQGVDELNDPIVTWDGEQVDNVLVEPPSAADAATSQQPDGIDVSLVLDFPRDYHGASLRGCKAIVRGETHWIVGDPVPVDGNLTPTAWNMRVQTSRKDAQR